VLIVNGAAEGVVVESAQILELLEKLKFTAGPGLTFVRKKSGLLPLLDFALRRSTQR
jgi:hypothetical protein